MIQPSYRDRLTANAEDFDAIVSEMLAENATLRLMSSSTELIAATIKVCLDEAERHMTATPIKIYLAALTPESILEKIKNG